MTKKSILNWLDEQASQGKKLTIVWDGGNDSGWVHFQIDGEEYEDEHTEHLVEAVHDELDYGSWAGDYSASGKAIYNSEEKAFIGVDDYRESESYAQDTQISVVVPKNLWFDTLNISVEMASYEDSVHVRSQFRLKNGFLTPEHNVAAEQINKHLESEVDDVVESVSNVDEVDSVWESITIDLSLIHI